MKLLVKIFTLAFMAGILTSCGGGNSLITPPANNNVTKASLSTLPANGSSNVGLSPMIELSFAQAMRPYTLNPNSIKLSTQPLTSEQASLAATATDGDNLVISSATSNQSNTHFYFSPASKLIPNTTYWVTLTPVVRSATGGMVSSQFSFTTGNFAGPSVSMIEPTNFAEQVNLKPIIVLQFSETVNNVSTNTITLHENSRTGPIINISDITPNGNRYSFSPAINLKATTTYYVVVSDGITDNNQHGINPTEFSFTTGNTSEPSVTMLNPSNNAYETIKEPLIQLQFNKPIFALNSNLLKMYANSISNGQQVAITSISPGANNTYSFRPVKALEPRTTYFVVLSKQISSIGGATLAETNFSFTTGNFIAPTVRLINPHNNQTNVALNQAIQIKFSEAVTNLSLDKITLRAGSTNGTPLNPLTLTPDPVDPLQYNLTFPTLTNSTLYYLSIESTVIDSNGNHLVANQFNFITGDFIAPTVAIESPTNLKKIFIRPTLTLKFSEEVINVSPETVKLRLNSPDSAQEATISITPDKVERSKYRISVPSNQPLVAGANYYLVFSNAITDLSHNRLTTKNLSFQTLKMQWEPITNGLRLGRTPKLKISPKGSLFFSTQEEGTNKALVQKFNPSNNTWELYGLNPVNVVPAVDLELAINPKTDQPWIVFQDTTAWQRKLTVMEFNGSAWSYQAVGITTPDASAPSMVITNASTPLIAYSNMSDLQWAAQVYQFINNWAPVGQVLNMNLPQLALDPVDSTPYLAYANWGSTPNLKLMLKKLVDNTWQDLGKQIDFPTNITRTKIAVAPSKTPYVAYAQATSSGTRVSVMRLNADGYWQLIGPANIAPLITANGVKEFAFAIAPDGTPYLAYVDLNNKGTGNFANVVVLHYLDDKWQQVGPDTATNIAALPSLVKLDLVISNEGIPYVTYKVNTNTTYLLRLN